MEDVIGEGRKRSGKPCPECTQIPARDQESGVFRCACEGKQWSVMEPTWGSDDDKKLLEENGFYPERDVRGEMYYVGHGSIVWLYADGTFDTPDTTRAATLREYLDEMGRNEG